MNVPTLKSIWKEMANHFTSVTGVHFTIKFCYASQFLTAKRMEDLGKVNECQFFDAIIKPVVVLQLDTYLLFRIH